MEVHAHLTIAIDLELAGSGLNSSWELRINTRVGVETGGTIPFDIPQSTCKSFQPSPQGPPTASNGNECRFAVVNCSVNPYPDQLNT
jgi:hypothetical protein